MNCLSRIKLASQTTNLHLPVMIPAVLQVVSLVLASGALDGCAKALARASEALLTSSSPLTPLHLDIALRCTRLLSVLLPRPEASSFLSSSASLAPRLARGLIHAIAAPACGTSVDPRAAQLQLQALHCLITASALNGGALMTALTDVLTPQCVAALRCALALALRSRSNAFVRQMALRAVSLVTECTDGTWLLGDSGQGNPLSSSEPSAAASSGPGSFLLLLATVAQVEVHVLLLDALSPDQPVPNDDSSVLQLIYGHGVKESQEPAVKTAADQHSAGPSSAPVDSDPSHSVRCADSAARENNVVDDLRPEELPATSISLQELSDTLMGAEKQQTASGRLPRPNLPMSLPDELPVGKGGFEGGTITAGERAERLLPPVLALLEAVVDAIATAADQDPGPIDLARLDEIFSRTEGCVEQLVDFLGEGLKRMALEPAGSTVRAVLMNLAMAATRCVGRFLAEVPQALNDRMLPLVPDLLALGGTARFLLPFLTQLISAKPSVLRDHAFLLPSVLQHAVLAPLAAGELADAVNGALVAVDALELMGATGARDLVTQGEGGPGADSTLRTIAAMLPEKSGHLASPVAADDPAASHALVVLTHMGLLALRYAPRPWLADLETTSRLLTMSAFGLYDLASTLLSLIIERRIGKGDELIESFANDLAFRLDAVSDALVALMDGGAGAQRAVVAGLMGHPSLVNDFLRATAGNDEKAEALGLPFQVLRNRVNTYACSIAAAGSARAAGSGSSLSSD